MRNRNQRGSVAAQNGQAKNQNLQDGNPMTMNKHSLRLSSFFPKSAKPVSPCTADVNARKKSRKSIPPPTMPRFVILSGASASRSEADAKSKDPASARSTKMLPGIPVTHPDVLLIWISQQMRVPHSSAFFAEGWETGMPEARTSGGNSAPSAKRRPRPNCEPVPG